MRKKFTRRLLSIALAVAVATPIMAIGVGAPSAEAYTTTWTYSSASYLKGTISGSASWYSHAAFCATSQFHNIYGSVAKASGSAKVDKAKVTLTTTFGVIGGSVSIGASGVGISINQSTKSCSVSAESATGKDNVSWQYKGTFCTAKGISTWKSRYQIFGSLRIVGTTWTAHALNT